MLRFKVYALGAALLSATIPVEAAAQDGGQNPSYDADYFGPFAPQTALDILNRTPGFTLDEGLDLRGFGSAAGNILVDGARPSIKAGGILEFLRSIPAARVARIEVIRGSTAAEMQGQTTVVNIVLRADSTRAGNASLSFTRASDGRFTPFAEVSYASPFAGWDTTLKASFLMEHLSWAGTRELGFASGGGVTLRETNIDHDREIVISGAASRAIGKGVLSVNARLARNTFHIRRALAQLPPVPVTDNQMVYGDKHWDGEIGGDYAYRFSPTWSAKVLALAHIEDFRADEDDRLAGAFGPYERFTYALARRPLETVLRASATHERGRFRTEFGAEGAYNRLRSNLAYAMDTGGGLTPIPLTAANITVDEKRADIFAKTHVKFGKTFSAEAEVAGEVSRIGVAGGISGGRDLFYFKPGVSLMWQPTPSQQLRLDVRRKVGQLSFDDFAASVDANVDREVGGNVDLRPDSAIRASLLYDAREEGAKAFSFEIWHEWKRDVLDYVRLPSGDIALGNIPRATAWGTTATLTLPVSNVIPGGEFKFRAELDYSRLRDPISGKRRRISGYVYHDYAVGFRQNLPAYHFAWGVDWDDPYRESHFYPNEHFTERGSADVSAFIETTAFYDTKITLRYDRGERLRLIRDFVTADPSQTPSGFERRDVRHGGLITLTVAKQF